MVKRIHVNQHVIRSNHIHKRNDPPLSIIEGGVTKHAYHVDILGPSQLIYSPLKPLKCGARIWISVEDGVEIVCK